MYGCSFLKRREWKKKPWETQHSFREQAESKHSAKDHERKEKSKGSGVTEGKQKENFKKESVADGLDRHGQIM